MTRTTTLDQVLQEAEADSMGALSADFRAAHSALLSDGLSIARVGSARVSRFGLAPGRPLPLLRSRCHGIADRFRCSGPQPETAPGFDRDHAFHARLPALLVAGCQLSVADTAR